MSTASRGPRSRKGSRRPGSSDDPQLKRVEEAFAVVLDNFRTGETHKGLDLANSPKRVARMYRDELLSSYHPAAAIELKRRFTTFPSEGKHELVTLGPIAFTSLCSHHWLPFTGRAFVGYLPGKRLVGLSKIPRVVEFFSKKLQLQERMTSEIADYLVEQLKPKAVLVRLEAEHLCMSMRGVRAPGVITRTTAVRGMALSDSGLRSEFLDSIRG